MQGGCAVPAFPGIMNQRFAWRRIHSAKPVSSILPAATASMVIAASASDALSVPPFNARNNSIAMNAVRLAQPFPPVPDNLLAKFALPIALTFVYRVVDASSLINQIIR